MRAFLCGVLAPITFAELVHHPLAGVVAAALLAGLFVAGGLMRMWESTKGERGWWT